MDDNKIRAIGYCINRVFLGIAAIVGASKTPHAISEYAVNVKTEQIVSNTMASAVKIVSSIKNENHNTIIQYKDKIQKSLDNPSELKNTIHDAPPYVLRELGLKTTKAELTVELNGTKTAKEAKAVIRSNLPDALLDIEGEPFTLDQSKLGQ